MKAPRTTIRHKLMTAFMLTSTAALLIMGSVFIAYETVSFRQGIVRGLSTRAAILAANSAAVSTFQNQDDARRLLDGLRTDPHMTAAALYDRDGRLFSSYSATTSNAPVPATPPPTGHRFEPGHLVVVRPVVDGSLRLGTLYLKSDLRALEERQHVLFLVTLFAVVGSIGVAFALSTWLQRRIAHPVLTLTRAAESISERKDYATRAEATSDDELGILTEAFNDMLSEIQERDTAIRTKEAGLRAILESALDCVITMNHEGRIVEFNPAAETLFGYRRDAVVGKPLADLIIPPRLRDQHRQGLARYIATGTGVMLDKRLELMAMRADGKEFPVELAITRILQDGPPMFTGFIRDITERKRSEQEIHDLNADLERRVIERTADLEASNQELEAFSYTVSHDLRAPLRAIDGFSKVLLDEYGPRLDDPGKRHLERVRGASRQMSQLIDDLLDLAKLSRAEMHHQKVDLSALGNDLADAIRQSQPERQVSFVIDEGLTIDGDLQLLRIALDNLLRNAWKFTSKHPTATIELGRVPHNGTSIYYVRDDGAGFDMAHADILFAPFQRLHRQSDFEGTGVGLATVHRIIQRHQGRVWAEGSVEHGATFYFTLWERSSG
ncbi:MAG TPA: PAS domain S-box protein [Candidatus Limnocylindria bacterium]|nr:PAS domain S-box protein [Candidatus Limnocylindria bacterium]